MGDASTEGNCCVCTEMMVDPVWECTRCHSKCHMHCILQWVLRTLLNRSVSRVFTCPVCRQMHNIRSLQGMPESDSSGVVNLLTRVFTIPSQETAPRTSPMAQQDDEENEEAAEEEEYEEGGSAAPRSVLAVHAQSLTINIEHINLYNTHTRTLFDERYQRDGNT